MFPTPFHWLETANAKAAAKGGRLACPTCGGKAGPIPGSSREALSCGACGTKASLNEWVAAAASGVLVGRADQPPAGTRILRETDPAGATIWSLPASGQTGGLLIFAIGWCSLIALISGSFLMAALEDASTGTRGDAPGWILIPFFGIFWAVGLTALVIALRTKYARHRIRLTPERITLRRELFGRVKERSLSVRGLRSIEQVEFYQRDYKPVFGIEIRGKDGKLRCGSGLTAEEKAWLVADLRQAVFGVPEPEVEIVRTRRAHSGLVSFSIPIPHSRNRVWPLAIVLTLTGIGCFIVGFTALTSLRQHPMTEAPLAIQMFDRIFQSMHEFFRVVWLLFSGGMGSIGLYLTQRLLRSSGHEFRFDGDAMNVHLRTYARGRVIDGKSFARSSVMDLRSSVSGNYNGLPMKRVEMIVGDKVETLATWIEGGEADDFLSEARQALGMS